jgi:hypothetical protein
MTAHARIQIIGHYSGFFKLIRRTPLFNTAEEAAVLSSRSSKVLSEYTKAVGLRHLADTFIIQRLVMSFDSLGCPKIALEMAATMLR